MLGRVVATAASSWRQTTYSSSWRHASRRRHRYRSICTDDRGDGPSACPHGRHCSGALIATVFIYSGASLLVSGRRSDNAQIPTISRRFTSGADVLLSNAAAVGFFCGASTTSQRGICGRFFLFLIVVRLCRLQNRCRDIPPYTSCVACSFNTSKAIWCLEWYVYTPRQETQGGAIDSEDLGYL